MKKTILLVEDSEAIREMMAKVLVRAGYAVLQASSGPEALKLLDFPGTPIELLIADVELDPGMNGVELALEVNARRPELAVLYISGVYRKGGPVEHFLVKPFSMDQLLTKVGAVLDGAERRQKGIK